jgi:hypothetical protein
MDIATLLFLTIFAGVILGTVYFLIERAKNAQADLVERVQKIQTEQLGIAIAKNLVQLKPENRYILSFPFDISDTEFDQLIESITATLDLENSNTHVVIVQGRVNMIEFN